MSLHTVFSYFHWQLRTMKGFHWPLRVTLTVLHGLALFKCQNSVLPCFQRSKNCVSGRFQTHKNEMNMLSAPAKREFKSVKMCNFSFIIYFSFVFSDSMPLSVPLCEFWCFAIVRGQNFASVVICRKQISKDSTDLSGSTRTWTHNHFFGKWQKLRFRKCGSRKTDLINQKTQKRTSPTAMATREKKIGVFKK